MAEFDYMHALGQFRHSLAISPKSTFGKKNECLARNTRRGSTKHMKISYNWLRDYVDIKLKPEELAQKLTMAGLEVTSVGKKGDDSMLEFEITLHREIANRAQRLAELEMVIGAGPAAKVIEGDKP